MKNDLEKLIMLVWMSSMVFFAYEMWVDINYITDLSYAYMQMVMQNIRR